MKAKAVLGKARGSSLCHYLNQDKGSSFDQEMEKFICLCKKLETVDTSKVTGTPQSHMSPEAEAAYEEVSKLLSTLVFRVYLLPLHTEGFDPPGPTFFFQGDGGPSPSWKTEEGMRLFRTVTMKPQRVVQVLELLRDGVLDRLRRCAACKDWFFAGRIDGKFCQTTCERRAFRTSPEQRKRNAEYQREYYAKNLASPRLDKTIRRKKV